MIEENKQPDSLELFHVQILKEGREEWFAKQIYTLGTGLNQYYQELLESIGGSKNLIAANETFINAPVIQMSDHSATDPAEKAFYEMCDHRNEFRVRLIATNLCLSQYLKWINEEILENIRSKEFPLLPSRKRGLWLCDFDSLHKWLEIKAERNRIKILKVKAIGQFHRADGGWISVDTHTIDEFNIRARNYWAGKLCEPSEPEFLFEGELTVLREYNAFDEIVKNN